jgi:flagellar motor switch/type III secretory pathway protein FliN
MSTPESGSKPWKNPPAAFAKIPFQLRVRAGRGAASVHEILALKPGALVSLDTCPAEPAELTQGDVVVARGEIVAVDGRLRLRITEVPS